MGKAQYAKRWKRTGRALGEGGQGQVLVVVDKTGEHAGEFALKTLSNINRRRRIDLEISTTKSLHRNAVPVVRIVDDYVESEPDSSVPWYVADKADASLDRCLVAGDCYAGSEVTALNLFLSIAKAVRRVHENGVAHRDLKPANILLHNEEIWLCDLGLCMDLEANLSATRETESDERIGSIHYMPPEAFGRARADRQQFAYDAYALGKILYEVLAGRRLIGFTPPSDEGFDLVALRPDKSVYRAVNALLRELLHQQPARRVVALEMLVEHVESLLSWDEELTAPTNEQEELTQHFALARQALMTVSPIEPEAPTDATTATFLAELAGQLITRWKSSEEMNALRKLLADQARPVFSLQGPAADAQLRELFSGPYINTHRAFEPLEDKGYPPRPSNESCVCVSMDPGQSTASAVPKMWLACFMTSKGAQVSVAFGVALQNQDEDAWLDFDVESAVVLGGQSGSVVLGRKVHEASCSALRRFALMFTKIIGSLIE